jgi:acyl-CoA dehydrogenase
MPGLETTDEMFDLRMSDRAKPLLAKVKAFVREEVEPVTLRFFQLGEGRAERWSWAPGQLDLLDGLKRKAKANGLWNFFLPDAHRRGLKNLDYAYIAEPANPIASECLNCRRRTPATGGPRAHHGGEARWPGRSPARSARPTR